MRKNIIFVHNSKIKSKFVCTNILKVLFQIQDIFMVRLVLKSVQIVLFINYIIYIKMYLIATNARCKSFYLTVLLCINCLTVLKFLFYFTDKFNFCLIYFTVEIKNFSYKMFCFILGTILIVFFV